MESKIDRHQWFRKVNTTFKFEPWMLAKGNGLEGIHGLGAAFALAGIKDEEFVRLDDQTQKTLFGANIIGKRAVMLRNGEFRVLWTQAYGHDWEDQNIKTFIK